MQDTTVGMSQVGEQLGISVGLTYDPRAGESERWVASVGLDCYGAGRTPVEAINSALADFDTTASQPVMSTPSTCDASRHAWTASPLEPDVTDRHYRREHGLTA